MNVKMPVNLGQQIADHLNAEIARKKAEIQHMQNMLTAVSNLELIEEPAPPADGDEPDPPAGDEPPNGKDTDPPPAP